MAETNVQALLDGVAAALDAPVALDDVQFRLLAHTAQGDLIDDVRRSWIVDRRLPDDVRAFLDRQGVHEADGPVRTPAEPSIGATFPRWCVPVRFRGLHFGYVWVLESHRIPEGSLEPAIDAAEQIGMVLYRQRLLKQADADLLRLLITPNPEQESLAAEARAFSSYPRDRPVAVVVVTPADGRELDSGGISDLAVAVERAAEQSPAESVLAGVISGAGVLLAPLRSPGDTASVRRLAETACRLAAHFGQGVDFIAAIGGAAQLEGASHSYAEARRAIRVARAMPNLGPVTSWDDLGVFRPLALLPEEELARSALDPRVRELLANSMLAETAERFLDLAGNIQQTAAALHLHRTALYHRLDRISTLYGLDLQRSGDDRLLVHLGLKLARLAPS